MEVDARKINTDTIYDLVIIGGGIHGACAARFAASAGLKTLLLERGDFSEATSSRSSKMAHGGLRYLEMFDFEQVFEGIKARENLFKTAANLVRPERFLIPIPKGDWFLRLKLHVGLFLYDLMVKAKERKHYWVSRSNLNFEGFDSSRTDLDGCFVYTDGLMSDARLVIENIILAKRNGVDCLNYAEVKEIKHQKESNIKLVTWIDKLSNHSQSVQCRAILNCAGPWVTDICKLAENAELPKVKFSRGVHVLFPHKWNGPSLFLPMEGQARYYFVWPHQAGTMVGTTEREVDVAEADPMPMLEEVSEIFARLEKDLPKSGLTKETAHYCFAGVRTIPFRGTKKGTAISSRKHIWINESGMLSLVGGKYTTASWTSLEGVNLILSELGRAKLDNSVNDELLPGSLGDTKPEELLKRLTTQGMFSDAAANRLVSRLGARATSALKVQQGSNELLPGISLAEVIISIEEEQVCSIEDIMRRRMELEYLPGNGLDIVDNIGKILSQYYPEAVIKTQIADYRERMSRMAAVLEDSQKIDN